MALFPDFSEFDVLPQEDCRAAVRVIPIHQNKLKADKGKIKDRDAASFKLDHKPSMIDDCQPEKSLSNNLNLKDNYKIEKTPTSFRRLRMKSDCGWRKHLNEKDS